VNLARTTLRNIIGTLTLKSAQNNAKIVVPTGAELVNVIGEMAGVLPLKREQKEDKK